MDITTTPCADGLIITLSGRLDASWSDLAEQAVRKAIHDGHHRLYLDMSRVGFISSAGIRVILSGVRQTVALGGRLAVVRPSEAARSVLNMAGMGRLVDEAFSPVSDAGGLPRTGREPEREFESVRTRFQVYRLDDGKPFETALWGSPPGRPREEGPRAASFRFTLTPDTVALGLGALGDDSAAAAGRYGEFLALGGAAVHDPAPHAETPDYLLGSTAGVLPFLLSYGLTARGGFTHLVRFETLSPEEEITWPALAAECFGLLDRPDMILAAAVEAAAFVGAAVKRGPKAPPAFDLGFPAVREQLSFTAEPAFPETSALVAGYASRAPSAAAAPFLRRLGPGEGLLGHFHAAIFPYRPIRKQYVTLEDTLQRLFEDQGVRAVLHLLYDDRPASGSGCTRVRRGACWIGPAEPVREGVAS